jgi:hypothetical protein
MGLAAALAVVCILCGLVGWSYKPAAVGFPTVPRNVAIHWPVAGDRIIETLTRTEDGGATLRLYATNGPGTQLGQWTVTIDHLGSGRLCTRPGHHQFGAPSSSAISALNVLPQTSKTERVGSGAGSYRVTEVTGRGAVYVKLCWNTRAPVRLEGSYLSARFPPVVEPVTQVIGPPTQDIDVTVDRVLDPAVEDTAPFNVQQSLTKPTNSAAHTWSWIAPFPSPGGVVPSAQQAYQEISEQQPIELSAIDVNGTAEDTDSALLSGIFLGVAGAALIALIQELVSLFRSRHDDKAAA